MSEEVENIEKDSEIKNANAPFSEEEKTDIRYWASKVYTRRNDGTTLDAEDARTRLEAMGCDLTRADELLIADLSEGQYADQIIMKGKKILPSPESPDTEKKIILGQVVRVERTSGEIEDDWGVTGFRQGPEGKLIAILKKTTDEGPSTKEAYIEDLEKLN